MKILQTKWATQVLFSAFQMIQEQVELLTIGILSLICVFFKHVRQTVQIGQKLLLSLGSGLFDVFLVAHLTLIQCELERRQKGDRWSFEGSLALAIYPTLIMAVFSDGIIRLTSIASLVIIALAFRVFYSRDELNGQIKRFTPGLGADSSRRNNEVNWSTSPVLLIVLLFGSIPAVSDRFVQWRGTFAQFSTMSAYQLLEVTVHEPFVRPLAVLFAVALQLLFVVLFGAWVGRSYFPAISVIVHSHLSGQHGHRFAYVWEVTAIAGLLLANLGLLGSFPVCTQASLAALVLVIVLRMGNNAETIENYLRRMRQLR